MRKLSWQYDDLAKKIQCPDRLAAKLVLRHLGSSADDLGQSHHGYNSIAAHCSINRRRVSPALRYLRDDLKIVTWVKGVGGIKKQDTNLYRLNLPAMKRLIATQGVFDATGNLIRVEGREDTGVEGHQSTGLKVKSKGVRALDKAKSRDLVSKVEGRESTVTLNEPSNKSKPSLSEGLSEFSSVENLISPPDGFVVKGDRLIRVRGAQ
jgi:hypothetical protein